MLRPFLCVHARRQRSRFHAPADHGRLSVIVMKPHHRRRLFLCTLLLLPLLWWALVPMTRAEWTLSSNAAPAPISLGHGATVVTKHLTKGDEKCKLTLVFFDESQRVVQVAANTTKKGARAVRDIAAQAGAIAACNGGYFEPPKMLPSGLEIAGGVRTGTLDLAMPFGGTFLVEGGKGSIIASEKFVDHPGISDLIQCCPRLVESGLPIKGIGGENLAQRTFVLTDGKGRWAIGVSGNIGLPGLASILCNPKILSELQVQSALNLDGGPSTALWCKHASGGQTSSPETWKVRNVILISPRKQGG
jgi:hypothetical protein